MILYSSSSSSSCCCCCGCNVSLFFSFVKKCFLYSRLRHLQFYFSCSYYTRNCEHFLLISLCGMAICTFIYSLRDVSYVIWLLSKGDNKVQPGKYRNDFTLFELFRKLRQMLSIIVIIVK